MVFNRLRACRQAMLLRMLGSLFVELLICCAFWLHAFMAWRFLKGDLKNNRPKMASQTITNGTFWPRGEGVNVNANNQNKNKHFVFIYAAILSKIGGLNCSTFTVVL